MDACRTCGGSTQDGISLLIPAYQHLNDFIISNEIGNLPTTRMCHGCVSEVTHWQKFVERWNNSQKKFHTVLASDLVDCSSSGLVAGSRYQLPECKVILERMSIVHCYFCNREFFSKSSLADHIESVHPNSQPKNIPCFACVLCNIKYHDPKLLARHVQTLHGDNQNKFETIRVGITALKYRCTLCQKIYKKYRMDDHFRSEHSNSKPFGCTLCGKKFCTMPLIVTHQLSHRKTAISCSMCGCRVRSKQSLRLHIRKIHESVNMPAQYKCFDCSACFKFKEYLKNHIERKHIKKTRCCKTCGEKFESLPDLISHRRKRHYKTTPVSCEVCQKSFTSIGSLNSHRVIHENRSFPCKYCDSKFTAQMSLNRHVIIQHSESPPLFKCEVCPHTSRWKEALARHILKVHGKKKLVM